MGQLNFAASFAVAVVVTVFVLTCWAFDGRPFEPPALAIEAVGSR